jgi:hypothetical protein
LWTTPFPSRTTSLQLQGEENQFFSVISFLGLKKFLLI